MYIRSFINKFVYLKNRMYSGNIDLALYLGEANKFVKLLTATGNRNHCKHENTGYNRVRILLKQKFEELIQEN